MNWSVMTDQLERKCMGKMNAKWNYTNKIVNLFIKILIMQKK